MFTEAAREGTDLILTRAPRGAGQAEVARIHTMIEPIRRWGKHTLRAAGSDREELLRRVQQGERLAQKKLTAPQMLVELYNLTATLSFEPQLRLDVTTMPPAETALKIVGHLRLDVAP